MSVLELLLAVLGDFSLLGDDSEGLHALCFRLLLFVDALDEHFDAMDYSGFQK